MITELDRKNIVEEAKTWLGTPWHHQAAVKKAGVDCAMFLREVYINANIIPSFNVSNYSQQWFLHRSEEKFLETMNRYGKEITKPLPGDAVIFKFGRCFSHGAIVIDWPIIIHSYRPRKGVVYDDLEFSSLRFNEKKFFEVTKWV